MKPELCQPGRNWSWVPQTWVRLGLGSGFARLHSAMAVAANCSFYFMVHGDVVLGPPASAGGFKRCSGL